MTVATSAPIAPEASVTSPATSATPPPRLVPVSIGRPGRVQVAHLPCPAFCVINHVAERVVAIEDISHRGIPDFAQVPTMGDDLYSAFEVYAQLYSDPASDDARMRVAAVVVTDGSREAYLTPDMADETADDLIAFAMGVKEKARIARRVNSQAE